MLRLFSTHSELKQALEETRIFPDLIIQHQTIANKLLKRFPECSITVLANEKIENGHSDKFWIILRETPWSVPFISFAHRLDRKFDKNELFGVFDELFKKFPHVAEKMFVVHGPEVIMNIYDEWHQKTFSKFYNEYYPNYLYYTTVEQDQILLDIENKLPEGCYFSKVDFESDDVEIICKSWVHAKEGDLEFFNAKIKNMPYSLVRDSKGSPVAYEFLEMNSLFNHQYVHTEHRGKGLGHIVERDLAKKAIKFGITPCKTVLMNNTNVVAYTDRCAYWKKWKHDGKPINYLYIVHELLKN